MIITGVRLCGRHLQLRRLLICNCEKLSISARLMQRLHHWPHQLPAGSELIRLLLLMGQRGRGERKGAVLSGDVPAAPSPWPRGQRGSPRRRKRIARTGHGRVCLSPGRERALHGRRHLRAPLCTGQVWCSHAALCRAHALAQNGFVAGALRRAAPCPGSLLPQELPWHVSSSPLWSWRLVWPCCALLCPALPRVAQKSKAAHAPIPLSPVLPLFLLPPIPLSPSSCPWRGCPCSQHLDQSASSMHSN